MELVGGEDLAARIAGGAVPIGEALPVAKRYEYAGREKCRAAIYLESGARNF
jgi:hypothetical protein